ncbi:hypothetical protein L227DRAFT_615158 [Lentinus tigrinus ALCF2SS1-6]|uniref:Uncharacterized protein n=1 Tax=Lentinus tigrinus ALCF2SS1-6 TaxID=1328759 RepID=A0A5C2RXJ4_9APHY|nr:hypothetical protein L227DRAFT_615158 [Lentinus tigrinus ALCF2SS1-6]
MPMNHTNERGNVQDNSTLPCFTAGELLAMLIRLFNEYELANDQEITEPCLQCLRWVVSGRGRVHMHIPADDSESAESSIWGDLSPASSFLAEHLPPIISDPSPAAQGSVGAASGTQPHTTTDTADSSTGSVEMLDSDIPTIPGSLYPTPEHVHAGLPPSHGIGAAPTPAIPFMAGAQVPIVPYIANESSVAHWYVVTRGRRVGVFDSSEMMVDAVSRVSGGTGRGGFATRDQAIAAFMNAIAEGIVSVV